MMPFRNNEAPKNTYNQHSLWPRKGFATFAFLVGFAMLASAQQAGAQTSRVLEMSVYPAKISEVGRGTSTVTIKLAPFTSTFDTAQVIDLTLSGTATKGTDYTISAERLFLHAGARTVTATITAVPDYLFVVEPNETVVISASHSSGTVGPQQTITIFDQPPALSVSLDQGASTASIAEAGGTATLTVSTGDGPSFASDQTVDLELAGTATENDDYTISAHSLTIASGAGPVTATITAVQDEFRDAGETVEIQVENRGVSVGEKQIITITDDDPVLSGSLSATSIAETAGSYIILVFRSSPDTFDTDQTITITLAGTATKGTDYIFSNETLTLRAGQTQVAASLSAVPDIIDESDETVLITASHHSNTIGSWTLTIEDNDNAPTLSVSVNNATVDEAAGTSTLTVSTSGTAFATDQTIDLTLAGTAIKDTDYTISAESLTLKAGETTATATVTAVQDIIDELNKTVLITASHNGSTIGSRQTITITDDDDAPTWLSSFSVSPSSIAEDGGTSTVTFGLSTGSSTYPTDQTIILSLFGSSATEGDDYTFTPETVKLKAGETTATATVTAVQDIIDEPNETVRIGASYRGLTQWARQFITIIDDDPTLSVSVNNATVGEAAGTSTVTVSTDGTTFAADQTITLALAGTATKDTDYTISTESLTLAAGATSVTATVTAVQDIIDEPNETVLITASHNGITIGSQQTVTITDDDGASTFRSPVLSSASIAEAGGTSTLTVQLSAGSSVFVTDQTITLSLAGTATTGDDYTITPETVTLKAGETTATATVTAVQDIIDEPNETVLITASHNGITIGSQRTVTIADDDPAPALQLRLFDSSITEAAGTARVNVGAFGSSFATDQTITLALAGTATKDTDYTISAESLTLKAGETYSATARVTAVQDTLYESDETVLISASLGGNSIGTVTVTIGDNNDAPTLSVSVNNATIAEAAGASTLTVSTGATTFGADQTITLSLAGTATTGDDYTITPETVTLKAGETTATATVTAVQDTFDEPNETVLITASHSGNTIGARQTVTITDDDDAPSLTSVSVSNASIAEAAGTSTLTVSTNGSGFTSDQTITLALAGTATKDTDYTISADSLTLAAGETSVTAVVTAVQDIIDEPNETVLITASHSGNTIGSQQTVTIADDDGTTTLSVSVNNATIAEAAGASTLTVSTGATTFAADQTITLALAGTATAGDDYTITPETVTLKAGETTATATVTAVQDTIDESDETVLITASHNFNTIGARQTVTIADDDAAPTFLSRALSSTPIAEAAGTATLNVQLSLDSTVFATDQTITLALAGTATTGDDYTITPETLTLKAGETTATVTVTAVQDTIDEPSETVLITFSHNGNTIGPQQTVAIADDDDAPTLSVMVNNASIAEAAGTATLTVRASASTFATDQTITLALAGTATKDTDYTISAESLTLAAGATSVTAVVTAVQDTVDESNETVLITASHGGDTIGSQQTVAIADDDGAATLSVSVNNPTIAEAAGTSTLTVSTGATTFAADQTITLTLAGTATETIDFTIGSKSLTLTAGQSSVTTTVTAVQDIIDDDAETVLITASHNGNTIGARQIVTITDDDDAPSLTSVSVSNASIAEAAGTSTLTVSTNGSAFTAEQTITLSVSGTATTGDDYTITPETLTLKAGETMATATVTAVQDTLDEPDETVLITATHNSAMIGSQQTVSITDDDGAPTLSISVSPAMIAEAAGTSTVTVSTGAGSIFATEQTITLAVAGTATKDDDFTISSESLTLSAGATSVTATVTAVSDVFDEANETVLITASHNGSTIGTQRTVTITDDDDAPSLTSVSVSNASIAEAVGTSTLTVSTNGSGFTNDQTITLALAGTATKDTDYTISAESLTLSAGATSVTATVTAVQDTIVETYETVLITASHSGNTIGSQQNITIADDDGGAIFTVSVNNATIAEAAGASTLTVSTGSTTFAADQTITLTLAGTATETTDFTIGSKSLTLIAGTNSVTTTVTAVQDNYDDDAETVRITATHDSATVGTQPTVTITDDDDTPTLSVMVNNASIAEAAGTSTVTVSTGSGSTFSTDQTITLSLAGTATVSDDYTIDSKSLTLPAGAGAAASSVTTGITSVQDKIDEANETILITATHDSATVGSQQTVTVTDDDAAPVLSLEATRPWIHEQRDVVRVVVSTLSGSTFDSDQTITLALAGTATEDGDYSIGSKSLTLRAGVGTAVARAWTDITSISDRVDDDDETILITATHDSAAVGSQQTVTIRDTNARPVLSFAVSPATIAEAAGRSTVTVSTGRGSTYSTDQTITLTLSGSATEDDDYSIGSKSLTLRAEATSVTTRITAVQDRLEEGDETVQITASRNANTIGSRRTVTITDDDSTPVLSFAVSPATIAEAAGTSTVTVSTGAGSTFTTDQTITLSVAGTATKDDDFTISSERLTLSAGAASVTATVTAVSDVLDEANETVLITASHNANTIGSQQTVTITDDDDAAVLSLDVSPATIAEAAGTSTVTVSTGAGSTFTTDQTITLSVAGTATKDDDFTISSESLTLSAGATSVTATVTAVPDVVDEANETVLITASHNSNAIGSQQTVTITDDDATPTLAFTVSSATLPEAGEVPVTLTISTSGTAFEDDREINFNIGAASTATFGDYDFGPDNFILGIDTLTLMAGTTSATITIKAIDDLFDDDGETVVVTAQDFDNQILTDIATRTFTITDNDAAPALSSASVNNATIAEAAGTSTLTVSTNGSAFTTNQTISLALAGTATRTSDYTISAESLTLAAGMTSAAVTVTAVQDNIREQNETVLITASHSGNTIGSQQTVTITDDDVTPTLSVAVNNATIAEAGGTSTVTVSTGAATFATDQTVSLTLAGTSAMTHDYTISAESLTLKAGESSATVTVTAVQDKIDEANETILIDAARVTGVDTSIAVGSQLTVTVSDDDAAPSLLFEVNDTSIGEASDVATLTVRTGTGSTFATSQTINLALDGGGTAALTNDFTLALTSLTLPAGSGTSESTITTTITAVQDKIDEANETILIDAARVTGVNTSIAVGSQLTVTVSDDDAAPSLLFEVNDTSIGEASDVATLTVRTGTGSTFATSQTINLALDGDGTAALTNDFTLASTSLTLPAGSGTSESTITTTITAVQDKIDEARETILIDAARVTGVDTSVAVGSQLTVTVTDDDAAPVLALDVSSASIAETAGASTVTVSTGTGSTFATDQTIALNLGGTATEDDDYTTGSTTLTLPAGSGTSESTITTTITAVDDDFFEGAANEQITVTGSRGGTGFGFARTITITDNEQAPKLTLTLTDNSISENDGSTTVSASVAPRTVDAFTATFSIAPDAPATAADYGLTGTLSFAALSATPTGTVTIEANNNRVDRPNMTVQVTATSSRSYFRATDAVTLTLEDDDAAPVLAVTVSEASIAENAGASTVTVTTGTGSTFATDHAIELSLSGTAADVSDYSLDTTLTLPAGVGANLASVTATITGVDDIIDDDAETILIDGLHAGARFGTRQTVTITDDDAAPVLVFTAQPASVAENGGVSTLTLGTGTGSTYATPQTITLAAAGTAIEDSDYTVGSRTLTLPPGVGLNASSVATSVTGLDDGLFEGEADQTAIVTATHAGATVGTQTVAVVDDEANSRVVLTLSPDLIGESATSNNSSQITASVSPPAEHAFVVDLGIQPDAPATAADFTTALPALGLLDFAAGATQSTGQAFIYAEDNDLDTPDKTLTVSGSISGIDPDTRTLRPAPTTGILAPADVTLTITDDDEAPDTVSLSLDVSSVAEDGGATPIEATATLASGARESAVTVTLTVGSGTGDAGAESGIDFDEVAAFTITIPAGSASATADFSLTPLEDSIDEPAEVLLVVGSTEDPLVGVPGTVEITIADNDDAPALTLEVDTASIAENGGTATVTVSTGTGSTFADGQTVELSVSGTATTGTDYTISSQSLTLPAGAGTEASSVTATVTGLDDNLDDDAETVVIGALLDGVAFGAAQTITIADDEGSPQVTLVLTPPSIGEHGGVSTVTATVSPASVTAFTVTLASAPASPAEAEAFEQSGSTLSFAPSATTSTGSVTITAVDNTADTPDRVVLVSGTVSSAGVSAPADATLTILDDDTAAVLSLQMEPSSIAEDGGTATVSVTTGTGSTFDTDQAITLVLEGTATQGDDYTVSATELTLPAGASSVTATVTGLDDGIFEGDETVLISGLHAGESFGAEATLTITDDEAAPAVTLVLTPDKIAEDGGTATVTATVSATSPEPFSVTVAVEPDAPAVAGDFVLSGDTLSFAANATDSTGEMTIAAVDNDVDAPDKTLRVSGTVSREDVTVPAEATLTIVDDDEASNTVTLSVTPDRIDEGAPATQIVVTGMLDSGARDADTVISLSLGGSGSAPSPGVDYEPVADISLTIPANAASAAATFTLTPLEDRIDEADEAVILTGSAVTAGIGVPETAAIVIADNDDAPVLAIAVDPATIAENGGTATVTVTTGEGSTFEDERTIGLDVAGTATQDEDYRLQSTTLTLPAGAGTEASSATVTVTALDDNVDDDAETIVIGGLLDGVAFGTQQTVTIEDDKGGPQVTLVLTPDSIGKNGGVSTVTATVSPASAEAFTVTVSAAAVAPAVAGDLTLAGTTLSFAADAAQSTGVVTITAVDNDEAAPDKSVTVSGSVSLDGVAAPADATLTIADDDEAVVTPRPGETPVVTLVLTPDSIGENGGVSTVTATVSPASAEAFTVTVSAAAVAPAVAGDFTLAGTTLRFEADATQSSGGVTITAVDNDEGAPDKTVTVSGTVSLDGVRAPADATLRIADDDEPAPVERGVEITLIDLTIGEGDETGGTFSVNLIAEPSANVTVTVSAPADSGLTVSPAQLTFTPADWQTAQTVTVTAGADDDGDDQTVMLTHSATGAGYEDVSVAAVTVTVTDRIDPGQPGVSIADARGAEADGQLVFDLTLSRAASQAVSVQYATRDGTARAGEDYEAGTGTATVAAGQSTAQIVVPLRMDLLSEPDETFVVTLTRADGAWLDDVQATGTIEDAAEDGAASQQWLSQFGRIAGGHVMAAIGDQIAVNRVGGTGVTVAGNRLTGAGASGSSPASFERFGQGGFGADPSLSATGRDWRAQPGERPWSGDGAGFAGAGGGGYGNATGYGNTAGYGFGPAGSRTMSGRELLANSAFLLNAGPGGGSGVSVWGRGNYTRFDNFGEELQTGGDGVSATLGVDWACARCLLGIALSHTSVDATYGDSGQDSGELESTVTGLYPYFGAQLTERFSVWGLVGQGQGELIATPTANARRVEVELETRVAGLGARGELLAADSGFSLAVKTDALVTRASTGEAEGILEAEGEYRRVRLGLEGAWLSDLGEDSSLRTSLEVAAREDAGEAHNGLGVEVGGGLKFIGVAPGLSLDLAVRGLVSHEAEDYEEWGVSGGFRYDPDPGTAAGPLVSLSHSWGPAGSGGLQQALWRNELSRAPTPSLGSRADVLSAEFAYGFKAFGALGIPWARLGTTGAGEEYRLGYSLLTHRGIPSLELARSAFGREYRMGWEFALRCRAQVAVQVRHSADALGERADTRFEIRFRSVARKGPHGGSACETLQPLLATGAYR